MLSASSRIWTRVAVSISYDDNHYTMVTSLIASHSFFSGTAETWNNLINELTNYLIVFQQQMTLILSISIYIYPTFLL